ncbi:LysE family translocator [Moritella sp. F3]|uniref:LysE family translocator n=1 Tax=Moritella sp. F3 TaxID=2718882 RepID=UPI0018E1390B|nr:LysE family translocator [Moritella sp. F3]GIC77972.1 lysine transporter LysE [Moritella sp. F1]GIC82626.1 lysine transporter LysE [Moritella sp. F3]
MSFESAVTFFIAIFIFGITPGPGVFAILARAMVEGPKKCIMLAMGMIGSDVIYLILACFGLATIAENWSEVFTVIRYLGAAYLIYLGYKMIKALPQIKSDIQAEADAQKEGAMLASFTQGFLISASNPKVILFYISFLPTFIDLTVLKAQDIALVSVLSSIALMSGLMLIAFGASRMAGMLKTPVAHQRLNRGAGSIMIAAGAYLAVSK